MKTQRLNKTKMLSLIMLVAEKFKRKRSFKFEHYLLVIWKMDMKAFQETGKSITGATWFKTKTGVSFSVK